jgi:glucose dehydrogenase
MDAKRLAFLDSAPSSQVGQPLKCLDELGSAVRVATVVESISMYGNWLFFMTPDDYLISLNARDGKERWRVQVADVNKDFFSAIAPIVIGNHVIVAPGNNDDIRAWLESRDPETGALQWRWWVDPEPGEPGSETWPDAETMSKGGGFPWLSGTYDRELNLYYFGTGNGVPERRPPHPTPNGDSLYTATIVALNPDTGKMAWAYQVTPHDTHDYDAGQTPILFDGEYGGSSVSCWPKYRGTGISFFSTGRPASIC